MGELGLIRDLAIVWSAAVAGGALLVRLKLPLIAAYILTGILIGPFGAKLISEPKQIHVLAEFGVALLLFALGVEISLRQILRSASRTVVSGLVQILSTVAIIALYAVGTRLTQDLASASLFGLICALSSTAVVTKVLVDRGETETLHARILIPILLIQDLSLIPIVALLPALTQNSGDAGVSIAVSLGKAALLVAMVIIGSAVVVPKILGAVSRTDSRELFTLAALAICLTVAFCSQTLGVSLALGAFLGGIMISERPYGHQVLADVLPLRDSFGSVFFVSIGLLLNPGFIVANWWQVVPFVIFLIVVKILTGAASALVVSTRSLWSAALVGVDLAQIGEFSFVLATLSYTYGLLPDNMYNLFFSGAVVTLILSPALIAMAPKLFSKVPALRLFRRLELGAASAPAKRMQSHLVLCGYGRIGRNLGLILEAYRIPYIVVDVRGEVIEELRGRGVPAVYGDAFSALVLRKAHIAEAACLVVTVPDPLVAMHVITYARKENPKLRIIARAHHVDNLDLFRAAGANAIVQPEFEASVEITKMALIGMHRSGHEVRGALKEIRKRGYMLFKPELITDEFVEFPHADYFGVWFVYNGSPASLQSLDTRRKTGATVLAIKRHDGLIPHPDGSLVLEDGDELYVAGNEHQLTKLESAMPIRRFNEEGDPNE